MAAESKVAEIRQKLADCGFVLSPVRILEILIWTEVEPRGGYREIGSASS
jgi:hypothetical protein